MNSATITANELAKLNGITRQAIMKRAKKGKWRYTTGKNRTKYFTVSDLPPDMRERVDLDFSGTLRNEVCLAFETEVARMIQSREKDNETIKRIRLLLDRVEQ